MTPTADTYFGVPAVLVAIFIGVVFTALFIQAVVPKIRVMLVGKPEARFDRVGERLLGVLVEVVGQHRLFQDFPSGLGHALIFWGFIILLTQNLNLLLQGFFMKEVLPLSIYLPLSFIWGVTQVLVIGGVLVAAYRRYILRLPRLTQSFSALLILSLIALLMVTDFIVDGNKVAQASGEVVTWSPMALLLAPFFAGLGAGTSYITLSIAWWVHTIGFWFFLAYIPRSKHLHIFASAFNVYFRSLEPRGALKSLPLEGLENFGLSRLQDFSWKDVLDFFNCTECGRCTAVCPANLSGKPLSPKHLILELQGFVFHEGQDLLKGKMPRSPMIKGAADYEPVWNCLTCFACQEACPVFIEHVPKIVDIRRNFVMNEGRLPETAQQALVSLERRGHPWRGTVYSRGDWAEGLGLKEFTSGDDVEYLYWVGCTGAMDDRSRSVVYSVVKVLQKAGVDFGILGDKENCTGDPARRMGNEYLFQMLAQQNIELLNSLKVKKIITHCPHCFNTLKNEYPQLGGNYEVIHHTQFIGKLVREGKIRLAKPIAQGETLTYHDSCYLGRYNREFQAPREILKAIPGAKVVEMSRNRERSFCCGAGGGQMWMEMKTGQNINRMRTEQAMEAGATTIATACPFCAIMFEDGIRQKDAVETLKTRDMAELVADALE